MKPGGHTLRWRWRGRRCGPALIAIAALAPIHGARAEEPFRMAPALAGQMAHVECRVMGGRIRLTSHSLGGQISSMFRGNGDRVETLSIDLSSSWPRLEYYAQTSEFALQATIASGEAVSIGRTPSHDDGGARVYFKQEPEGDIEFSWQEGDEKLAWKGPTLWHLCLAHPHVCRSELAPLLKLVRPQGDLTEEAAAVEQALLSAALRQRTDHSARWRQLVGELAHDDFARRRSADRALRTAGLAVAPFLRGLDDQALDAEQRLRVRRILYHLTRFDEADTPSRAALWLVGDQDVWLSLLARDDASVRRTAAAELERLLGRTINFDPAADAATRSRQWERLRIDIASPTPK